MQLNKSTYDHLHDFARRAYESKVVVTKPRSEYINSPFLIFLEHLDNPRGVLDDIDPRRRKYTYLISIKVLPKDKSIRLIRGDIHKVECEMRLSNIGHVYGIDVNLLSMFNNFPQPIAAFLSQYLN